MSSDSDIMETFYNVDSGEESGGDDVDFAIEEVKNSSERQSLIDDYPFQVLSTEEMVEHMNNSIKEVKSIVKLPATTTRILLSHFKWDKERLMERLYDGDQEKLFSEARVVNPFTINKKPKVSKASTEEECEICYMALPASMMTGLECGHRFCTQCWRVYLTSKIMEEGMGQTIACAAPNCNILVNDKTVMRIILDSNVSLKYKHLITNSFVQCNRLLRWCPSPDCDYAVKVLSVEAKPVKCRCLHMFCFSCGENWHEPVNCLLLKKWIAVLDSNFASFNWIAANTKHCPKCNVSIEKNGGCNHMICANHNCRTEFCWVCLGNWYNHGSCNRYEVGQAAQEKSRATLDRYIFYCKRYKNHLHSMELDRQVYVNVKKTMEEILECLNISRLDIQFLSRAVDILCQCRRTLMNSYIFAYYVRDNNQLAIFEENQKDLESATETLSEYLERDITSEFSSEIKQKVQDKYTYCDIRRKVLLEHVHEGYEKNWWDLTEQ